MMWESTERDNMDYKSILRGTVHVRNVDSLRSRARALRISSPMSFLSTDVARRSLFSTRNVYFRECGCRWWSATLLALPPATAGGGHGAAFPPTGIPASSCSATGLTTALSALPKAAPRRTDNFECLRGAGQGSSSLLELGLFLLIYVLLLTRVFKIRSERFELSADCSAEVIVRRALGLILLLLILLRFLRILLRRSLIGLADSLSGPAATYNGRSSPRGGKQRSAFAEMDLGKESQNGLPGGLEVVDFVRGHV